MHFDILKQLSSILTRQLSYAFLSSADRNIFELLEKELAVIGRPADEAGIPPLLNEGWVNALGQRRL